MSKRNKKRRGCLINFLIILVTLFLLGAAAFVIYISQFYRASDNAMAVVDQAEALDEHRHIVFAPEKPVAGFIFYPGGKVQYEAYAPLMEELAKNDVLCVIVHMPGNLAVLDIDAAEGIKEEFPQVSDWYIGGHSLGGSMAASYASKHSSDFEGLILLAAYSTEDLKDSGLDVVSIYGSEDFVLGMDKYEQYKTNLPEDTLEYVIEGGNHAGFGDYGDQKGDGEARIMSEEQIKKTVEVIRDTMRADEHD